MFFFQTFSYKFSFNQVFRSKKPCDCVYRTDFCPFLCVSHRSQWGGEELACVYCRPLTARYDSTHTSQRFAAISHGFGAVSPTNPVGKFAHTRDA